MTATEALIFLPFVIPVCFWVAFSDMKLMKIPNVAVLTLAAIFLVVGPFVLPIDEYLWRILNGVVVLAIGFVVNLVRLVGAGDAKFAAAMAPFFPAAEAASVFMFFAAMLLVAFVAHRVARSIGPIRRAVPDWKSWDNPKFPMGLALSATLAGYLGLSAWLS